MKWYRGGALIQEKEHNETKYKIEVSEYNICPDEKLCDIICEVTVKIKFLFFWITIWKESIYCNDFKNIDDYNDEVEYIKIKAEDILKTLTD